MTTKAEKRAQQKKYAIILCALDFAKAGLEIAAKHEGLARTVLSAQNRIAWIHKNNAIKKNPRLSFSH